MTKRASKRPPKKWWEHCVAHVKKASKKRGYRILSPEQICGAEWARKMSPAAKRRAKRCHPER